MSESKPNYVGKLFIGAFVYALGFLAYFAGTPYWIAYLVAIPLVITIEVISQLIVCTSKRSGYMRHCTVLIVSAWVASFAAYHLSTTPQGAAILLLIVTMVAVFDTFSQVGGVIWKNFSITHQISPNESENKTKEGTVVGYLMSIIAGIVVSIIVHDRLVPDGSNGVVVGLLVSFTPIVAYFGDINESMAKRRLFKRVNGKFTYLKDFSGLLGPVGGVSDRYDGMVLAISVVGGLFELLMLFSLI